MQKTDSLLRTKLHQPAASQKLVSRERLQSRIAEGISENPLTVVIAPAGFGKTTLVTASLAGYHAKVAWFSIDRDDNQINRFLPYLIAALQSADSGIGIEAAQIISGMHQAVSEAVLTSLINDIDSSNQEIVLVLDDFQNITDQEVLTAVAFLLDHCPVLFHLLIATRADPHLPLSRLRARGQMVELRAIDLRFTQEEALQFLNNVMGLRLGERAVEILDERTEGWIAGLQMAALSLRDRKDVQGFIEGFSGTNRHINDFLLEEIMSRQSPDIQQFLLYTSILDRLMAPLCDALIVSDEPPIPGEEGESPQSGVPRENQSSAVLSYLERENIFLVSLDEERTWFRYHHLFSDLLRAKLHQTHGNLVARLHIAASVWLESNGLFTEAIQHLLLVEDYRHAADLIEHYGPACLEQSDQSVIMMAEDLPHETLMSFPKLGLYQAWLSIIRGNLKKAIPLLANLNRQLNESDHNADQRWMQTVVSTALAFLAPASDSPEANPLPDVSLLDEIPAKDILLRYAADFLYGMALARKGKHQQALETSIKFIEKEKSFRENNTFPTLASFVTRMYLMTGQLRNCFHLCHEYLDPILDKGVRLVYTAGSMKIDLGEVSYEWDRMEEAEQYIRDGLKGNEPWQNIMTDGFGLVSLVRVLQAKGDYFGAMQAVERLETILKTRAIPREFEEDLYTLRIRVQLASGELHACSVWADQIRQNMDYIHHKDLFQLTLARIFLAQGKFEEVRNLLSGTTPTFSTGSRTSRQIEFNLLLATAYCALKRDPEAISLLESSLLLGELEGHIRVFIDGGKPVQEMLTKYLRSGAPLHESFAQKLLNSFIPSPYSRTPKPPSGGLIEPLSRRELEVLQLIAQGKTNQEIAQQLVVARGTIKAQAASIYRKLGTTNRTEAVARARQLGILP